MNQIQDYLKQDYKAIRPSEDLASVQDFFKKINYSHFPVTDHENYIGNLNAQDAVSFEANKSVADYHYALESFFAKITSTWFEVLEIAAKNQANVVPVLNEQNAYVGYYELDDVFLFFQETTLVKDPGYVLVVQKEIQDYAMGQIAQIVESNNGKVLGVFVSATIDSKIEITLKLAIGPLNEIIQTFRRYNYEIVSHHQDDQYMINLKERSDYLDKYLNI